jgi:sulfofructosephosphate aldolase
VTQAAGAAPSALLDKLQTPGGHYAMLALDQRESLRGMFSRSESGDFVDDQSLKTFKKLGVEILTPYASAVLLDRPFGLSGRRPPGIAPHCGLIVAVDVLHQNPGHEITHVTFDDQVTVELLHSVGADAVKLLVLWHPESGRQARAELVDRALERASDAGVATLVEGIVRPEPGRKWTDPAERHDAILACAQELSAYSPDIYKAEVPGYVPGDVSRVAEQSALMTRIVERDWVVLSNGVERDSFASAVAEARRGGASGFLAGRAIWADAVADDDVAAALRERSVARLENLTTIVDRAE